MTKLSKGTSLVIVLLIYAAAFAGGLFSHRLIFSWTSDALLSFFIGDVIATIIVWLIGLLVRNSSMYDPYWSVTPIVLMVFFILLLAPGFTTPGILLLIAIAVWGVRLTLNWIRDWPGMKHEDWRYVNMRNNPSSWHIQNFFGIHMIPTLIVFAGMIPAYFATAIGGAANMLSYVGLAVCLLSALIQFISDGQMRAFRKQSGNKGQNMASGLWKNSRHPNYFGEIAFWWGVWLIQLSVLPSYWWTVAAPVLMTMLFVFISIPLMEKKLLASKEGYSEYIKNTSMLLPLPRKS